LCDGAHRRGGADDHREANNVIDVRVHVQERCKMQATDISKLLAVRPFEPLLVRMNDGRTYEIRRPGMAIVTPDMMAIGLSRSNGSRLAERIVRISIGDIANIESLSVST
jgi:hypothetical protein